MTDIERHRTSTPATGQLHHGPVEQRTTHHLEVRLVPPSSPAPLRAPVVHHQLVEHHHAPVMHRPASNPHLVAVWAMGAVIVLAAIVGVSALVLSSWSTVRVADAQAQVASTRPAHSGKPVTQPQPPRPQQHSRPPSQRSPNSGPP